MEIALLGGTGDIGQGLALRLAYDSPHQVIVGSRDAQKARTMADEYETELASLDRDVTIDSGENANAAAGADVVICSVPAYHLADTISSVSADLADDAVLVSPAVGMSRDEAGVHYNPPGAGSVTQLAAKAAPDHVSVVGAFHNLAAGKLANLEATLAWDVLVVGDDADAKDTVMAIAGDVEGFRPLDAGALANAAEVESLTPLLINLAANNDHLHDLGVTFQ